MWQFTPVYNPEHVSIMYNIEAQEFDNTFDVMLYTISAMKEAGYENSEIDDYIAEAIRGNNYDLVVLSSDKISECNDVLRSNRDTDFEDSWRDYYYNSEDSYDWDDDFDLSLHSNRRHYYWEDDLVDDRVDEYEGFSCDKPWNSTYEDDEDDDAYEGYSTCGRPYYNAIE